MLIAAALIELALPEADSVKARRRVARAIKDRVRARFNVSIAEIGDTDDRHAVCVGCVQVGTDPRRLRERMERVIRFVEGLGLGELVADDVTVARLDEVEELAADDEEPLPTDWSCR